MSRCACLVRVLIDGEATVTGWVGQHQRIFGLRRRKGDSIIYSPVNDQIMADDQTHARGAQQDHDVADLVEGGLPALARLVLLPHFAREHAVALLHERVEELREQEAWRHGVDADVVPAGFEGGL